MGKTWKDNRKHDRSYYEGSYDKKRKNKDLQRNLDLRKNRKNKRTNYEQNLDEE